MFHKAALPQLMPQRCQRLQTTCGYSPDDVVVESVSAADEVKTGSQFSVGRSLLVVVKSISLSLMLSLAFFEQALLTIPTITATNTITSTMIATVMEVALVVVFIGEVIV